jgi:hypothetical protein
MVRKTKKNEKACADSELAQKGTEQRFTGDTRDQELAGDFREYEKSVTAEINDSMRRIRHGLLALDQYSLDLKRQPGKDIIDISLMFRFRDELVEIGDHLFDKLDLIKFSNSTYREHYESTGGTADLLRKEVQQSLIQSRSRNHGIPTLLTADDVAKILGITGEEVDNLANEGRLGYVELTDKKKAYTMDLIAEFIEGETYRRSWRWDEIKLEVESYG